MGELKTWLLIDPAYFWGLLVFLSIFCVLEKNINTDNLFRLFGLLLMGVGALVALAGKTNVMVWVGVILIVLTYVVDLANHFRKHPWKSRKGDK